MSFCFSLSTVTYYSDHITAQTSDRSIRPKPNKTHSSLKSQSHTRSQTTSLHSPTVVLHPATLSSSLSSRVSSRSLSTKHTHALSLRHIAFLSLLSTRALMRHTPSCSSLHSTVSPCTLPRPSEPPAPSSPLPPFLYADSNELSINMLALSAIRSLPHAPSTFVSRAIACRR